jgi:pimeloyl-ACP methyl ester carboxylesterase
VGPVQFATNGRVRIAFSQRGPRSAPPLLMIRGLARTSRHWGTILDELEPSFRLVLIDNRGVGNSGVPLLPFSTRTMADDARSVLDALGIARAHVFGVSLGGMIAQQLAVRSPSRVDRLVLGCTRPGGASNVPVPAKTALTLLAALRHPLERAVRESARLVLGEEFIRDNADIIDEWVRIAEDQPPSRRAVLAQILAAVGHDASRELQRLAHPTLVVTGDADRLINPENSRRLAATIPGAELRVLGGAGHDFPTERASETAGLLREFLLAR